MRPLATFIDPRHQQTHGARQALHDLRKDVAAGVASAEVERRLVALATARLPFYARPFAAPVVKLLLPLLAQWIDPSQPDPR